MKTESLNLFIVDNNPFMIAGLKTYLENRFGSELNISTFTSGSNAIQQVNHTTDIVILDYSLTAENGNEILKSIKGINPKTEVIMHSSNEDIGVAIAAFRHGATDYVLKGEKSWKRLTSVVYNVIVYPVRIMVQEFGINKYLAMFLMTFTAMGVGVALSLHFLT